jgi:NADPH:quinone reductase-like Zn-dependent oxidoreductase
MKAIHLTAYGNPAQNLVMVEVSEPNAPSASEALVRMEYAPIDYSDLLLANGASFCHWRRRCGNRRGDRVGGHQHQGRRSCYDPFWNIHLV